ncbi:MAG: DeoR/GlpR family DNA-binding transcription regulator [Gammaproteobacteria bacterium]|nr:DeoR/GlpR family DNA-binding transcription regulator [Gammaproteobacteria bacterium]
MPENTTTSILSTRQNDILEFARVHGEVEVDPLAELFNVTPQTIRRDLNQLCDLKLLQRVHGGAIVHDGVENLGYAARKQMAADKKNLIGQRAAELIANDSSLFINIGTTTEWVAEYLKTHTGLLVITNNINVVNTLRPNELIDVMTAGGTVRREDGAIVGQTAVDFFGRFKVDYAVVGASAIEKDGALLDYDIREVRVAQAIISNARSVILVADAMKFERNAPVRIANIGEVDFFVTDEEPPPEFMELCQTQGVQVEIVSAALED